MRQPVLSKQQAIEEGREEIRSELDEIRDMMEHYFSSINHDS